MFCDYLYDPPDDCHAWWTEHVQTAQNRFYAQSRPARSKWSWGPQVEQWRPLVAQYFRPSDVNRALCLIHYESRGDPDAKNPTSSASGLFQHLGKYWPERSVKAGWAGADIFDPEANVAVAAWLRDTRGGWYHWSPYGAGKCR